jgi:RNA polymerase sigma-70 factor (ECF subfamily)
MRYRRRDTRRRVDLPLDDWLEMVDPHEPNRSTWDVDRHLAVLPVGQRKVVRAIAVEGASVRSVAQELATSEGVVRMTLHRAISRLLEAADATPTIKPRSRNRA